MILTTVLVLAESNPGMRGHPGEVREGLSDESLQKFRSGG
jgi:hypothetical protein